MKLMSKGNRRFAGRPRGQHPMQRAAALVAVTALVSGAFTLGASSFEAAPANAVYAEGGEGLYKGSIDWFQWSDLANQPIPAEGVTKSNTRSIAGQDLVTTCTIADIEGVLQTYRPGSYAGDGLDELYNVGGTGGANQMVVGLVNTVNAAKVTFHVACTATLNGATIPLQGLVFADAEASTASQGEYIEAKPDQAANWRVIDRYRDPSCATSTLATVTPDGTMRLSPDGIACYQIGAVTGPTAVGFMEGATSARMTVQGGGRSAVALGVVLQADFGDAPASYGEAGALFEPTWSGGEIGVGTTPVSGSEFALGTPGQPVTRLGATVDSESGHQASDDALGDDRSGDEVSDEDGIENPGTLHVTPGGTYTLPAVSCTGPGFVSGWIDWNRNGVFDEGERSAAVECAGDSVDLAWTVPADALTGPSFMRLRIAKTEAEVLSPVGMTTSGEVEDYAVAVELPKLAIEKSSDATANSRPGDVVTYRVTATNNGKTDFTDAYPAVVLDDISGVLDDAGYNNDLSADRAGETDFVSPLLSWAGSLPAGESVTLSYTATIRSGGDGTMRNVAWQPADPGNPSTPACAPPENGVDAETGEGCAETVDLLPRLTIEKSADRTDLPAVGETIEYTVTVKNVGPGAYTAEAPATFTDDLSDVLDDATFNGDADASIGTTEYASPELGWSGPLNAGESATVTYSVTYTGAGDQLLRNTACVPQPNVAPGAQPCDFVQVPGADLYQWKDVVASATPAVAGTQLSYTLHFKNDGKAPATVDAIDNLSQVIDDAEVTSPPVAGAGLTATLLDDRITVTGSVQPGETATVTYTVAVRADGERGDDIASNFLLAPGDTPPTGPECAPSDTQLPNCTATPIAALQYHKSVAASATPIGTGTVLTYTITAENTGAADGIVARADVLTDVLDDADLTSEPVSDTKSVTVSRDGDRLQLGGTLAAGATALISYEVTVKAESERGNNSVNNFLTGPREEPKSECLPETGQCTITPLALVSAVKTVSPESGTTVTAGQEVTYTLTFANAGNAEGAVDSRDDLSDVLDDAELTGDAESSDPALAVTHAGDTIRIVGVLQPGQTASVSYSVIVRKDGERGNNVLGNLLAPSGLEDPECGDSGVTCTENPVPELALWKTVDPASGATVQADAVLSYTLHFENVGRAPVEVSHDDALAAVLDDADVVGDPVASSDSLSVGAITDGRLAITGVLAPGAHETVTYQLKVKPDGKRGDDRLSNFLIPSGTEPPIECAPSNQDRPTCTENYVSDVVVDKSSDPASGKTVKPGDVINYTLTFTNVSRSERSVAASVDYTDHLVDVLDDATVVDKPVTSDPSLRAALSGDEIRVKGKVASGAVVTVTYSVRVNDAAKRGDGAIRNVIAVTGTTPQCVDGSALCTEHKVPPVTPTPPGLAITGAETALWYWGGGAALLLMLAGAAVLARRRSSRSL